MRRLAILLWLWAICACSTLWAEYRYRFRIVDNAYDRIAQHLDSLDYLRRLDETFLPYLHQLDSIATLRPSPTLQARTRYWDVKCHQYTMGTDSCITRLQEAITLTDSGSYDDARFRYQLAGNLQRSNQLARAWHELEEHVMPILRSEGDSLAMGNAYHLYAFIYRDIGDLEAADESLSSAQECFEAAHYPLGKVFFLKALMSDDPVQAQSFYLKAIDEDPSDVSIAVQAYTNLASAMIDGGDSDTALQYIQRGLATIDSYQPGNKLLRAFLLVCQAQAEYNEQRYDAALSIMQEAESLCGDFIFSGTTSELLLFLSRIHDKLEHTPEAYRYLKTYVTLQQDRQQQLIESKAQRQRDRDAIHVRQQEIIDQLTQQAESQRIRIWMTVSILMLVLLTAIFAQIRHREQRRQRDIENRELRDVLQQETVGALLSSNIKDDEERSRAEAQMGQVRPGFFAKLKEINPDLTDSDLRLCTYISIGMRAKEIAQHLSVTPDSVNTARYRLRKKLNLQSGDKLDDFLRNL